MESRTLEIELQYAKDLNKVNLITKMDVYVVVSISGGDRNYGQKTKSTVDHDGDANPTWNFTMKFTVEEAALQQNRLTLDFKLVCQRALGDKDIGEVNVPIKELFDSPAKGDGKQILSYQVRKPSGKPKGQLTFAYKFGEKIAAALPYAAEPVPMTAYPAASSAPYPRRHPGCTHLLWLTRPRRRRKLGDTMHHQRGTLQPALLRSKEGILRRLYLDMGTRRLNKDTVIHRSRVTVIRRRRGTDTHRNRCSNRQRRTSLGLD